MADRGLIVCGLRLAERQVQVSRDECLSRSRRCFGSTRPSRPDTGLVPAHTVRVSVTHLPPTSFSSSFSSPPMSAGILNCLPCLQGTAAGLPVMRYLPSQRRQALRLRQISLAIFRMGRPCQYMKMTAQRRSACTGAGMRRRSALSMRWVESTGFCRIDRIW